jgi:hypothetical protein
VVDMVSVCIANVAMYLSLAICSGMPLQRAPSADSWFSSMPSDLPFSLGLHWRGIVAITYRSVRARLLSSASTHLRYPRG